MARILIVGGGRRGRRLAERMVVAGHAVRSTTRSDARRAAIEATGAECWIGTPDRLATLRGALENVTIACWMLACARGSAEQLAALHSSRLEFFLGQAIDTTARGLIYDAALRSSTDPCPQDRSARPLADRPGKTAASAAGPEHAHPSRETLAEGARIFRALTQLNAIPAVVLGEGRAPTEPDEGAWLADAERAVASLLDRPR